MAWLWLLLAVAVFVAWAATRRDDGRTPPTFDCGRDGCRWRGKVNHRHRAVS